MASGDLLALQIYQFKGKTAGRKAYIQANLHGAEIAGNVVIYDLIQWLTAKDASDLAGEIWLVPLCNPMGVNQRSHHFPTGRYSTYEGQDWNRIFWDYAKTDATLPTDLSNLTADGLVETFRQQILASFAAEQAELTQIQGLPLHKLYRTTLQSLALDADYLIDLHSSSNRGLAYLYYFDRREDGARLFDLDFGILLDKYDGDAFDEAFIKPWLALEALAAAKGQPQRCEVEAYTLEIGTGMKVDPVAVEKSLQGVKNYLVQKGLVKDAAFMLHQPKMPLYSRHCSQRYYATAGGVIQHHIEPGARVQPGDPLYELLSFNKTGDLPRIVEVRSQHSGFIYDVSTSEVMNQGEYVLALIADE
ncbi:MAG: succinylglutamate desuccinylase/aspartoacylase family protein [Leptolyngbya sp. SIO4C1]|nr:succinylglutamate desuccinylase/aspartoacylase family protein [Leptolyngbya sp. SIO4C1]